MSLAFSSNISRPSFSTAQTLTPTDQSPTLTLAPTPTSLGLGLPPHGSLSEPRMRGGSGGAGGPQLNLSGPPSTAVWPYPPPPHHPAAVFAAQTGGPVPGAFTDGLGPNQAPSANTGASIMENWENWRQFQQAAYANNLDPHMLAFYHNTGCPMDLSNAPRRKNATRETTSMLKAWLNEHRKNPYPTKGEKIMLAIITKMTLTQVSTWFANARRRLKKENKMTWSPRNRSEEERQNDGGVNHSSGGQRCSDDEDDEDDRSINVDDEDDIGDLNDFDTNMDDDDEVPSFNSVQDKITQSLSLDIEGEMASRRNHENRSCAEKLNIVIPKSSVTGVHVSSEPQPPKNPKIWSLVDTATKEDSPPKQPQPTPQSPMIHPPGHLNYFGGKASLACPPGLPLASLLPSNNVHMFSKLFPSILLGGPPPPPHNHHPGQTPGGPHLPLHMGSTAAAAYLQNPFLYAAAGLNSLHGFPAFSHGRSIMPEARDAYLPFPENATLFYGMEPSKTASHSPKEYSVSSSPSK